MYNKEIDIAEIKYTIIPKQELLLALDRLTRFKHPTIKYNRVFSELTLKYLLSPKLSRRDIDALCGKTLKSIVTKLWNDSVNFHNFQTETSLCLNKLLLQESLNCYNLDDDTLDLIDNEINICGVLDFVSEYESAPINIKRLIKIRDGLSDVLDVRAKYGLRFPVEKVVLCEGITEEILLPKFAKLAKYDFDKNGVKLISAGGKNQVAKMYCRLKDELKLPIFILLDADATETQNSITKILRPDDEIYLIKKGEFEDIFSVNLMKRTINNRFKNICECRVIDFKHHEPMTHTLSEFYRVHELGDFQKADFAKELAENLKYDTDLTEEILLIIEKIQRV